MKKIPQFCIQNRIIIVFLERIDVTSPPGQPPCRIAFSAAGLIIPNYMPGEKNRDLLLLGNGNMRGEKYYC
ncbi:MAG: hypothetical protein ABIJ42_07765 [Acidobacteriota bacterium]